MAGVWLRISRVGQILLFISAVALLLNFSGPRPADEQDRARAYTRDLEFEYLSWMLDATRVKAQAGAAGIPAYLDHAARTVVVSDYLQVTDKIIRAEDALNRIYADPGITDKDAAAPASGMICGN